MPSQPPQTNARRRRAFVVFTALLMLAALLPTAAGAQVPGTGMPSTDDPRVGLEGGYNNPGTAASGLEHVGRFNKANGSFFDSGSLSTNVGASIATANSDLAFSGDYAIQGNWRGFQIHDISEPTALGVGTLVTEVVCPGGQHDPTVYGDLLFISVESMTSTIDCGTITTPTNEPNPQRFRGVRIFDISDVENPEQVGYVQTCRGSHTHRLVWDPEDDSEIYIYNNGTSGFRPAGEAGLDCTDHALTQDPVTDDAVDRWQVEVIRVPLDDPGSAEIVNEARLFADGEVLNGLQNTLPCPASPDPDNPADTSHCAPEQLHPSGVRYAPLPNTNTCHDITAYPAIGLAAGACQGNGLLIDIRDPANPVRIDAVADPNFSYWHSANFSNDGSKVMFTDEWGGGSGARCRATDRLEWGANALFDIVEGDDGSLTLEHRSYYKMPAAQTDEENCVAHQANIVPVPGRDIIVQAWYQGGISMFDWTDTSNPYEIAYFDRGPINPAGLVLAGFWSGYWYNGTIFGSEIQRGLDAFEMVATEHLTENEIAAANAVQLEQHNPMSQRPLTWEPSFEVVLALRDQAERAGLSAERLAALDEAIAGVRTLIAAGNLVEASGALAAAADDFDDDFADLAGALRALAQAVLDSPGEPDGVTRLSGPGRIETAVAVSQDGFGDGEAATVVLARADSPADALAGTPLAVAVDAPVLLTPSNSLHPETAEEIQRVLDEGETVHIVGGTAAINANVEAAVEDLGYDTVRISGATRIETSVAIAEVMDDPDALLITTGYNFPDALAAGAAGGHIGGAVLLTTSDTPHPAIDAYLDDHPADDDDLYVAAVGGPAARAYPDADPVVGATREETAVEVADAFFEDPAVVGFARRDTFPDALTGGAHVGRMGGPMLLTPTHSLHPAPSAWLCAADVEQAYVFGGTAAISRSTAEAIAARIDGEGC